jgi:hypothetical protein
VSSFYGRHGKGAMRTLREVKHVEAEARNALTPPERRRAYRRTHADNEVAR